MQTDHEYFWKCDPTGEDLKYQGKFIGLTEKNIEGAIYEKVYLTPSVTIFPINDKGEILFIKEFRAHETPQVRWKAVTGFYETRYSLEENINRELQEEIGFKASHFEVIHEGKLSGTLNVRMFFVLAKGLVPSKLKNPDGEDVIQGIKAISLEEAVEQTLNGELEPGFGSYALLKLKFDIDRGRVKLL